MTPDDALSYILRAATQALHESPSKSCCAEEYCGRLIESGDRLDVAAQHWNHLAELKTGKTSRMVTIPEVKAEMDAWNSMAQAAVNALLTVAKFPGLEHIDEAVTGKRDLN